VITSSDAVNHARSLKMKKASTGKGLLGPVPPLKMNYEDR